MKKRKQTPTPPPPSRQFSQTLSSCGLAAYVVFEKKILTKEAAKVFSFKRFLLSSISAIISGKFSKNISWIFLELSKHVPLPFTPQERCALCPALNGSYLDKRVHCRLLCTRRCK